MGMKDVMRYWTKKTNQLIRQKKYIDKAKAYWDKLDERHNRARDYSGRGIKISESGVLIENWSVSVINGY